MASSSGRLALEVVGVVGGQHLDLVEPDGGGVAVVGRSALAAVVVARAGRQDRHEQGRAHR